MVNAYRLVTGADGHSHVQRGSINADVLIAATTLQFRESPASSSKGLHTAPVPQYVITLTGVAEFTTSGGETFRAYPGDVLLVTDTTGSGHAWRIVGKDAWKRACVVFSGADAYFAESAAAANINR